MTDLKSLYDAALAAEENVKSLKNQMIEALNEGTEEGKTRARELRAQLDAAKQEAEEANQFYVSAREAEQIASNPAAKFVPNPEQPEPAEKQVMSLADFNQLTPRERLAFSKAGGKLE